MKGTSHWWFIGKIDIFILVYVRLNFLFSQWQHYLMLFLYFVVTLIAAVFHAQMSFNCSNSLWWVSEWYLSLVPSLNWDSTYYTCKSWSNAYHKTIFSHKLPCYRYWVYWLYLDSVISWHGLGIFLI